MDHPITSNAEPIPGYRLLERLGRGGYGEVWKCEAPGGIQKAIKFVSGNADGLSDEGQAAEQEYRSLNRVKTIRHPFLLSIERFEVIDGQLIIVMELADRNLWDRFTECQRHGLPGIPRGELLRYMEEAAEALDLMNLQHQIQHLDIKPQNIFLVHQHVKVADFGLAKDLEGAKANLTGGITPTYAPPETFDGWVSRQSDQYSLAIVFAEMLTGRRPFDGANTRQLIFQHLTAAPDLSALPPADRAAVGRALSKVPDERFTTCAEFVRALGGDERPAPQPAVMPASPPVERVKDPNDTDVPAGPTQLTRPISRRSVPALVTPASRQGSISATASQLRRSVDAATIAKQTAAPAERVGNGILAPALILGVGGIGLTVLRSFRHVICERFGKPTLPHFRWLYVDTDPAAAEAAVAGPSAAALAPADVLITPLQRPTHYLSREGMPAVDSWLPPEELFRMPRTPATDGVRGLGRLALCDHHELICQRLRTALEPFLSAAPVEEADRLTKLGVRSSFPRVYLATSLCGGTGSGMFLDLAYLVRREASRLGFGTVHVIGLLGVPAVVPGQAETPGLANARAALAELNHFGTSGTGYRAQFDTRDAPVVDSGRPFRRSILLPLGPKPEPVALWRAADVAANVVFTDLLSQVGRAAHPDAETADATVNLVGVRRLAWPRASILRASARLMARATLQGWIDKGPNSVVPAAAAAVEALWAERQFDRAGVRAVLEQHVAQAVGKAPIDHIDQLLLSFTDRAAARTADAQAARGVLTRLTEVIGVGADETDQPHEFGRLLGAKLREVGAQNDARSRACVLSLLEQPGLRFGGAEEAVRILRERLEAELGLADRDALAFDERAMAQFMPLYNQLFGSGAGKGFRPQPFVQQVRQWAHLRIQVLLARACARAYRFWLESLPEHARELATIRNVIAELVTQLDPGPASPPPAEGVYRAILPQGQVTAQDAAARLVGGLRLDDAREFENALQARIRHEHRGLAALCTRGPNSGTTLVSLVLDQALRLLDARAPHLPAPAVLEMQGSGPEGFPERVAELLSATTPPSLGATGPGRPALVVLAGPADPATDRVAHLVRQRLPDATLKTPVGSNELVLYLESRPLSLPALPHLADGVAPTLVHDDGRRGTAHTRTDVAWTQVGTP
jgi:eukaryotic-like serine/threonine-protein kinase